nr:bacteriocin maturation protein [Caldalkalibacillus salinus]
MRLKLNRDTFYLPDHKESVYFRNNVNSFSMQGTMIDKWIDKLLPMFTGEHTLEDLTSGLPEPYRNRVYEIAEVLYRNGYVKDVSQDHPHRLSDEVLKQYASQIAFLDSMGDSSAYRFQQYRDSKILAIGVGPILISLISALIESGQPHIYTLMTDRGTTHTARIEEVIGHAQQKDPDVTLKEISYAGNETRQWKETIEAFDAILYVSQEGHIEELRELHKVCREEKKIFLPALCINKVGLAGPVVHPETEGCWESAWRRIHNSVFPKKSSVESCPPTAGAMLANVIVFECLKVLTGVSIAEQKNRFYQLNLETLEGSWYPFLPHPFVSKRASVEWLDVGQLEDRLDRLGHNTENRIKKGNNVKAERVLGDARVGNESSTRTKTAKNEQEQNDVLVYFNRLVSPQSGIFHVWEEGDLKQLPLAQCRVQPVDPLSTGPAALLPSIICSHMTHKGARREAGLVGIELYATRFLEKIDTTPPSQDANRSFTEDHTYIGVGAGETFAECVYRGLQQCLTQALLKEVTSQAQADRAHYHKVSPIEVKAVEDELCQMYVQVLTTSDGAPTIGLAEDAYGFPVAWVYAHDRWYASVDIHETQALKRALLQAIQDEQNQEDHASSSSLTLSPALQELQEPLALVIPPFEASVSTYASTVQQAIQVLERSQLQIDVFECGLESTLKEGLAGVSGVTLREVNSS